MVEVIINKTYLRLSLTREWRNFESGSPDWFEADASVRVIVDERALKMFPLPAVCFLWVQTSEAPRGCE